VASPWRGRLAEGLLLSVGQGLDGGLPRVPAGSPLAAAVSGPARDGQVRRQNATEEEEQAGGSGEDASVFTLCL